MSDAVTSGRAPGTETCACCAGLGPATPLALFNRDGLGAISYRIGDHARFKASLVAGLSSARYPALARLRTRDADDYTLGLLDAFACAADVLTFYQERIANESFLRTATERVSLQELGKLTGYRLRPGLAAATRLAFALEAPRAAPAAAPPDPGAFVTGIPAQLTLDAGLKVQSVPGASETPQTFETIEAISARPEWNALRPWLSELRYPGFGATEAFLTGVGNNLKTGDALVLLDDAFLNNPAGNNNWDFRLIDSVELDHANERTRVTWQRPLGALTPFSRPAAAPRVHVLRKRAAPFGHNAPMWRAMSVLFRTDYLAGMADPTDRGEWPDYAISALPPTAGGGHIDLDGVLPEVRAGSLLVLARGGYNRPDESFPPGTYVELYKVTSTAEVSRAQFGLAGKVSRLTLAGQNLARQFYARVRATSVFVQSEEIALAPQPVHDHVAGGALPLAVAGAGLLPGRRLIVHGERADGAGSLVHEARIASLADSPNGTLLVIAPPLPAPLRRHSVVVHANVAAATHGESAAQILGSGAAGDSFQRFALQRLPLTYLSAANEAGAASALAVRVGDVEWRERPTLFGAAPTARAYCLTVDEQGRTWVAFGDGLRGARLPSGTNNVRAQYRQGLGRAGNVGPDRLTQLMTRPPGLKGVTNPLAAQDGADPEPASQARRSMPLHTRTLGRVVSVLDYGDFALAFAGIGKAQAAVLQLPSGPTVAITVAGQDGAPLAPDGPTCTSLLLALKAGGDPHVNVVLLPAQASTFRIGLKVKRDPAYAAAALLAALEAALRAHFAFEARALGQPVLQSELIAAAHAVPGVLAVDLDFLYGGTAPPAQTRRSRRTRLLASRMQVRGGVALAAELLTLDPAPFDRLEEMP